jgi:hypothetical protein
METPFRDPSLFPSNPYVLPISLIAVMFHIFWTLGSFGLPPPTFSTESKKLPVSFDRSLTGVPGLTFASNLVDTQQI